MLGDAAGPTLVDGVGATEELAWQLTSKALIANQKSKLRVGLCTLIPFAKF